MSTGSRGSGHFSHYSTASFGNSSSGNSQADSGSGGGGDVGIIGEDQNANLDPNAIYGVNQSKTYRDRTQAWWTVGEYLDTGRGVGLTHQSAKFTLTGNRVFGNQKEEIWDLSDSLMDLFEANQREHESATMQLHKRHKAGQEVNIQDWLSKDTTHGFIRVYAPDNSSFHISQLIPCTLSTSAHKICLMLGISLNALHVQMNGDIIRRLDPYEHPLVLQNEYLAGLGYSDICRIQEEGSKDELGYLIRFYAGKPFHDSTFSRNQLQAFIDTRKGKMLQQWVRRLCVISGTRLLIYKDKFKHTRPSLVQLAKGSVEEVKFKGHDLCLKLTSTQHGEKVIYLSFSEIQDYNKWFRKCKKATDKLPSSADLSNCHLEFLPETIFINDQLTMLNLRHNVLKERPIEEDIYTIGWIDDLPRFGCLRSLNLADNNLLTFPMALCFMKTLVELNIASNKLEEIPAEIQDLTNLQALHLHNNHLSMLPDELVSLRKLFILVLAFNRFTHVPPVVAQMTDVRTSEIENMIMAGNQISKLSPEILTKMKYVKKVDFRMNELTLSPSETMRFTSLEHLTHLDVRDNYVNDLDIRSVKTLEYLNCDRNDMESLQLNGQALKNLFAANNRLEQLIISPKPEWLLQLDVSHNKLRRLPEWLSDCFFLQRVNISHNKLTELPSRLFIDGKKLKYLRANHNCLESLPAEVDTLFIEELYVQHNYLAQLPNQLLAKSNKLRVLNAKKKKVPTATLR